MTDPTHEGRQVCIHMKFGCFPVVMVRVSRPDGYPGDWVWGRWRMARLAEVVQLNTAFMTLWKD